MKKSESNDEKLREIASYIDRDEAKYSELISAYLVEVERERNEYSKNNPIDAPNLVLNHAIIEGIGFNNDNVLSKGNYLKLFEIGKETFWLWTYEKNTPSILVVKVSPEVKKDQLWKTSSSILEIAFTFQSQLEYSHEFDYDWIYRFDPKRDISDQHYLKRREYILDGKTIKRINELKKIFNLIELILRDDKFYVSCQNIIAAKSNHEFCQICAFTPIHYKKHIDDEPQIWERTIMIPKMEAAIVQATRSIEAILGKPGNRDTPSKLQKAKERWQNSIGLDPDEIFKMVGKSYLEYYYDLFSLRGSVAHSFGKLSFHMSRSLTIEAQSFAWIVITEYFKKNCKSNEEASKILNVNQGLVDRFPENYSTNSTKL